MPSISIVAIGFAAITTGVLGLVALVNNSKQYTNKIFAALSFSCGLYVVINFLVSSDAGRELLWVRGTFLLAAWMVLFLLLFINSFPRRTFSGKLDSLGAIGAAAVTSIVLTPAFIPSVAVGNGNINIAYGPLYPVFLAYLAGYLCFALYIGIKTYSQSKAVDKSRLRYVAWGAGITASLLILVDVALPLLQGHAKYASLGAYFILIFTSFCAYAVIKHRMFNIRLLAARTVTYMLLLATLAVVYSATILTISSIFFKGRVSVTEQNFIGTILALILAFTFQPLRRFFERVTDSIFYQDRYDSQQVLNKFTQILVSEIDLDHMLRHSLTELCHDIHVQYGQIVVFNHDRVYRVQHYGPLPRRIMVAPELRKLDKPLLVADELDGGEQKHLMDDHGIRVSLELRTREEHIGYLLLGDKLSGDIYSSQDLELLEIISKELAVAISNAKAFAEIAAFNVTLQQRVDHATNRLRVANRHLKELDHAKDEFISMASHQLRTPLTTIKGYLSMMLEGDAGKLTKSQAEFVDYAFGASERMVNLISDLLNVSRLSAGRFLIQTRPTDMVDLVTDEVRQLRSHADHKGIYLNLEKPDHDLPPAEIDDGKTRQVIMNFIDNAIYYTKEGGVTVRLEQTGDHVRLTVNDTGIGVPRDAQKKLFSKFFRAENAQIVRPDGTGLGLYLARRVIEDQGGTIIFNSTEGKGSTFGFELPLTPLPKPKPKHKAKKEKHG